MYFRSDHLILGFYTASPIPYNTKWVPFTAEQNIYNEENEKGGGKSLSFFFYISFVRIVPMVSVRGSGWVWGVGGKINKLNCTVSQKKKILTWNGDYKSKIGGLMNTEGEVKKVHGRWKSSKFKRPADEMAALVWRKKKSSPILLSYLIFFKLFCNGETFEWSPGYWREDGI